MFFYKCNFFDDVDLLGLEPAQATVVWDLISVFNSLETRATSGEFTSATDLKGLELYLYHVLNSAYPGGERREKAMASEVGKIYFDLRFRLHELWDRKCSSAESDDVEDKTESSNETFSRFIVSLLADGKSKSQLSKEFNFNKSTLSRSLSKKTLEQVLSKSSFSLGLVSGRESKWELPEQGNFIVDRLEPLTIRELHCCAIGSKIGQMLHRDKSLLFGSAFEQLTRVRQQVASSMIEITGIDLGNEASISAFEALCRQATYAVSDPESYLFKKELIGGDSYSLGDSIQSEQSDDSSHHKQTSPIADWLEDFHCGKLLPSSNGTNVSYLILTKSNDQSPSQRNGIEKYIQNFLAFECDETSQLIARGHWKDAWTELINQILERKSPDPSPSDEATDLILRQHAMLTRGLLELQMLAAYKFYAACVPEQRKVRIERVINDMRAQLEEMERYVDAEGSYQTANFVRADMLFHLVITNLLQKHGKQFLPANAAEMEKYLSVSLLGRDELRFRSKEGRRQIINDHEDIVRTTEQYLWTKVGDGKPTGEGESAVNRTNDLLATKEVAWALGKHLFEAIHDESNKIKKLYGSQKNIAQLQEVALMFELMLSQGLKFDPIKLWEKGEIDRLIYLSDCFPPKELVLWNGESSEFDKSEAKINQIRLVLAMDKVIKRSVNTSNLDDPELKTIMAIFVRPEHFINELTSNARLSNSEKLKARLSKAYFGSEYNCKRHVQKFKDQVTKLFAELTSENALVDLFCNRSESERTFVTEELKSFFDPIESSDEFLVNSKLKQVLDCIQVYDLPPEVHKQFIIEAGGTVAWHLNGSNLIYTYRQDLSEGVSRVVDMRGDRKSELFDFIYSMVEKAGLERLEELMGLVESLDNQNSNGHANENTIKILDFLKRSRPSDTVKASRRKQKETSGTQSDVSWDRVAATILFMILPMFQIDDSNIDVFRDTCVYNKLVSASVSPEVVTREHGSKKSTR
jgi:hypothetical protein